MLAFAFAGLLMLASHGAAFYFGHRRAVRQCRRMAGEIVGMMLTDPKIHIQR